MTFHPDQNLPGCMMPDGGDCCAGHAAVCEDWHKQKREIDLIRQRLNKAEWVLESSGFRRCDIAACNCGSWHQVGGYAERFREIREAVEEAGYSTNGKILLDVVKEIIAAADTSGIREGEL